MAIFDLKVLYSILMMKLGKNKTAWPGPLPERQK